MSASSCTVKDNSNELLGSGFLPFHLLILLYIPTFLHFWFLTNFPTELSIRNPKLPCFPRTNKIWWAEPDCLILRGTLPSMGHTMATQLTFSYTLSSCGQYSSHPLFSCTSRLLSMLLPLNLGFSHLGSWFWILVSCWLWSMPCSMWLLIRKPGLWRLCCVFSVGLERVCWLIGLVSRWRGR